MTAAKNQVISNILTNHNGIAVYESTAQKFETLRNGHRNSRTFYIVSATDNDLSKIYRPGTRFKVDVS